MVDEARRQKAAEWIAKGRAALKANDPRLAREYLLKAKDLDPANADIWLYLAATTRDLKKRKALLERALSIDPKHAQARQALEKINRQMTPHFEGDDRLPPRPPAAGTARQKPPAAPAPAAEAPVRQPTAPVESPVVEAERHAAGQEDVVPGATSTGAPPSPEVTEGVAPPAADVSSTDAPLAAFPMPTAREILGPLEESPAAPPAEVERCPRCGAVMRSDTPNGALRCVYCGYGMAEGGESGVATARLRSEETWAAAREARACLNCGAISIVPAGKPADTTPCPLCMKIVFAPPAVTVPVPEEFVPFKITEAEAAVILEGADIGGGGLRRLFGGRREISRPRAVYISMWLFSGVGTVEYASAGSGAPGGMYTETFSALPVQAVPQMDAGLFRLAADVPLAEAIACQPESVQSAFVLLPGTPLHAASGEARGMMLTVARQRARQQMPAGEGGTGRLAPGEVRDLAARLALLPLWVNDIFSGGQFYTGWVSGYTGRVSVSGRIGRHGR